MSFLDQRADNRSYDSVDGAGTSVVDAFTGSSRLWGADFIFKWAPGGNSIERQFKFQAEFMHRTENGALAFDTSGSNLTGSFRSSQSRWYVQSVYQFRPRWRVGLRYDSLHSGDSAIGLVSGGRLNAADFADLAASSPDRVSAMLDWNPSEFTRLRLQYAEDQSRRDARDHQLFLQYPYSIGAHGAHKF